MTMNPPTIYIKDVCLDYHDNPLFKNFALTIPAKSCICLLGQSGVGKSTLLRAIAHLITDSKILNFSVETSDQLPIRDRIVYMAQEDGLMPWLNVLDNVLIGYRLRKKVTAHIRAQALSLLKQVGLEEVTDKRPDILSGGMRQRVALARTLMEHRPIVLMDEPFSALDIITRLKLQDLAAELLKDKTVLLVTHDPLEALRLGDIIYVLSGQPVQLSNPIKPIRPKPRDPTDAELLALQADLLSQLKKATTPCHSGIVAPKAQQYPESRNIFPGSRIFRFAK